MGEATKNDSQILNSPGEPSTSEVESQSAAGQSYWSRAKAILDTTEEIRTTIAEVDPLSNNNDPTVLATDARSRAIFLHLGEVRRQLLQMEELARKLMDQAVDVETLVACQVD